MTRHLLICAAMVCATPAAAQHVHGDQAAPQADRKAQVPVDPHAGHDMRPAKTAPPAEVSDPHAGHDMSAMTADTDDAGVGQAPAPPPPTDHAADAIYGAAAMHPARVILARETGYYRGSMVRFDLAEYQARKGGDGYRWEGEAWYGGDIDKVMLKTEGEGTFGQPVEQAEAQLLYARAVAPYWNAQLGLRHDFGPDPDRTYAVLGIEGTAPYWFDLGGQLFLSDKGEVSARIEASYDQRITQRLVLAPRIELNFAAADVPSLRIGSGLTDAELGVRLRYEISRKFAPYVGVERARKLGDTARFARLDGEDPGVTNVVAGIRFWF